MRFAGLEIVAKKLIPVNPKITILNKRTTMPSLYEDCKVVFTNFYSAKSFSPISIIIIIIIIIMMIMIIVLIFICTAPIQRRVFKRGLLDLRGNE